MFQLPREKIHSLLSKMMLKNELQALWDQTGEFVLLNHRRASKIQSDSLYVAEKLLQFVDCNESMVSSKGGNLGGGKNASAGGGRGSAGAGGAGIQGGGAGGGPGGLSGPGNPSTSNSGNQAFGSSYYSRKAASGQYKHKGLGSAAASSLNARPIRV
ncbi:translation initiation factor 3 subunit C [Cryptosporidium felis]|nr:translation initiation factor 3 subunit C [Cryptosporidium felis]